MKALQAAHKLDPEHATLHEQLIRMRRTCMSLHLRTAATLTPAVNDLPEPLPAQTAAVMKEVTSILPASDSLAAFNDAFLTKHKDSISHVQSGLRVRAFLDPATKAQNEKDLIAALALQTATMKDAQGGLSILSEWKSDNAVRDAYVASCQKRWPESSIFAPK